MTGSSESISRSIAEAMQTETDGYHFYMMAANATTDHKGREVFTQLAQEELGHLKVLKAQHEALVVTGRADPTVRVGKGMAFEAVSPIFSDELRGRIAEAHFEMSALSIGISLELASEKQYREHAQSASDPDLITFFESLADWEAGHYQALLRQLDELKEDYWSSGGFSPW